MTILKTRHFLWAIVHAESEKKVFFSNRRPHILKLFDSVSSTVAEFDVSLIIRREYFKYDSQSQKAENIFLQVFHSTLKNVKLSLIVLHLHISLFVNQNVKNCMSSSVHVEASLNQ